MRRVKPYYFDAELFDRALFGNGIVVDKTLAGFEGARDFPGVPFMLGIHRSRPN